jgi:YgiT-type zinc finger domain-containing protein
MYGYKCEYCEGTVKEKVVAQEAFKHRCGFVILENVPVGVCDKCGYRYYHSSILRRVEEIAGRKDAAERAAMVPVASFVNKHRRRHEIKTI